MRRRGKYLPVRFFFFLFFSSFFDLQDQEGNPGLTLLWYIDIFFSTAVWSEGWWDETVVHSRHKRKKTKKLTTIYLDLCKNAWCLMRRQRHALTHHDPKAREVRDLGGKDRREEKITTTMVAYFTAQALKSCGLSFKRVYITCCGAQVVKWLYFRYSYRSTKYFMKRKEQFLPRLKSFYFFSPAFVFACQSVRQPVSSERRRPYPMTGLTQLNAVVVGPT